MKMKMVDYLFPLTLVSLAVGITVGFMTIRSNIATARDVTKKASEDRIAKAESNIIQHVDSRLENMELKAQNRSEQILELKEVVERMEQQIVELEKKAVAYDLKVPELERMKEEFLRLKRIVENKLLKLVDQELG